LLLDTKRDKDTSFGYYLPPASKHRIRIISIIFLDLHYSIRHRQLSSSLVIHTLHQFHASILACFTCHQHPNTPLNPSKRTHFILEPSVNCVPPHRILPLLCFLYFPQAFSRNSFAMVYPPSLLPPVEAPPTGEVETIPPSFKAICILLL